MEITLYLTLTKKDVLREDLKAYDLRSNELRNHYLEDGLPSAQSYAVLVLKVLFSFET